MPDELDHEVIDSPQALFRHLYEAHGVIEALDLDPDTAPLQFWLRRHSDLERAVARAAAEERRTARAAGEEGSAGAPAALTGPEPRARLTGGPTEQAAPGSTAQPARGPADRATGGSMAAGGPTAQPTHGSTMAPSPRPAAGSGSGPRFRPFADPLVEAIVAALIGRGLDERRVRRGLSTFTGADRRHGEDAVRATFVVPMLDALAAHLAGNPRNPVPSSPARREPAAAAPLPPATTADPVIARPSAGTGMGSAPRAAADSAVSQPSAGSGRGSARDVAEESLIAQPLGAPGTGPAPDADFMAIADVLQERRRSRRGGRRDATAARASGATAARGAGAAPTGRPSATAGTPAAGRASRAAATGTSASREPDDDVMALVDAVQRRASRRQPGRQSGSRARGQP